MDWKRALWILSLLVSHAAWGFRAYDCWHPHVNVTAISLRSVAECEEPKSEDVVISAHQVQVVQEKEWVMIHVMACLVKVTQRISHCGMHSHSSEVHGGMTSYIQDIDRTSCEELTRSGRYQVGPTVLSDIHANKTTFLSVVVAGQLSESGSCYGAPFASPGRSYSNVVVQQMIEVQLMDHDTLTDVSQDQVAFTDGSTCRFSPGSCIHSSKGSVYWDVATTEACGPVSRSVIYEGIANMASPSASAAPHAVVTVNQGSSLFSLTLIRPSHVCHQEAWATDHHRVYVIFRTSYGFYFQQTPMINQNIDLMMYMNSKVSFVANHLENAITEVYKDLTMRDCNLERLALQNRITLARYLPFAFGNIITDAPGYLSVVAGEVAYVTQCQPVDVALRRVNHCYGYLPVIYNNHSYFVEPYSQTLTNSSHEIPCSDVAPPMYLLDNKWYSIGPQIRRSPDPTEIHPAQITDALPYTPLQDLLTKGIYSNEMMESYRKFMSFPLNQIEATGFVTSQFSSAGLFTETGYSGAQLLGPLGIEEVAHEAASKAFGWMYNFGAWAGAVWGAIMIGKVVGKLISIVINSFHLYSIFGFSMKMMASLLSPLTHWIINTKTPDQTKADLEDIEMQAGPDQDREKPRMVREPILYPQMVRV